MDATRPAGMAPSGDPPRRQMVLLSLLVAVIAFVAVAATMRDAGLTWDEPAYMGSAQSYGSWFTVLARSALRLQPQQALSREALDTYWTQGQVDLHPPLGKILPALTWRLLKDIAGSITAMRLGNALIFAGLTGLICLMGMQLAGVVAGLFAALSFLLMPRLFFHGHLTALDVPVAFAWLLTVWLFWRWSMARQRLWPGIVLTGLAYGLALGTKNTSFVLPVVLLIWVLLFRRTWQAFALLAGMVVVAALMFVVTWPWLYGDLPGRLLDYVQHVTIGHWDIGQFYLGRVYTRPPWHYPFVILAVTLPVATLLVAILGSIVVARRGRGDAGGWLVVLNAVLPLLFFAFVSSQAYGGERLFLVVFPFVALLAGLGFAAIWHRITVPGGQARRLAATVLAALLLLPGAIGIVSMHPYELSYFSEAIGGLAGAQQLGLELTYWCDTYAATLPFLNAVPEQAPTVWTEEDGVLYTYRQNGMLRPNIQAGGRVVKAGPAAADYALIQRRPSGYTPEIEAILSQKQPVFTVRRGDTDLAYLFKMQ